jgi:cysteine desulfurase/selenocysteine lyase
MRAAHTAAEPRPRKAPRPAFDVAKVRRDFPILSRKVRGRPLIYLDNAATSHKPKVVLEAERRFYSEINSNIHRGIHFLSERATAAYEEARARVQRFVGAAEAREIVFVRGTTEAVNLVAASYGRTHVGPGDEIVISTMEHHSNIVPWQLLCQEKGAVLRVVPVDDAGELDLDAYEKLLGPRTKIVSIVHVSNALGTINPVKAIAAAARARGAVVVVDGAQAAPHLEIDVRDLGCDFYAFSGHKVFGPMGVGVLYGRGDLLEAMPPYQGGGDMISSVTFERTTYNKVPHKFEAGTPNVAGVVGLAAALDYVDALGREEAASYEDELLEYATEALSAIPGVRLVGTAREKASVVSFDVSGIHPHDVGTVLDQEGIAVRAGHHCTQPLMQRLGLPATSRASMAFYNTREEIDALAAGVRKVQRVFG